MKYEVMVAYTKLISSVQTVEADSEEEAQELAVENIIAENWDPEDPGSIDVSNIKIVDLSPVSEGA